MVDEDDYLDMTDQIETIVEQLYNVHGPVALALTIHTATAIAALNGYSKPIKETLERSIHMMTMIKEDKGTMQ